MSYGYGGGRANPFDQRDNAPAQPAGGYQQPYIMAGAPSPRYGGPVGGRDEYAGQNVEMAPLTGKGSSFGSNNSNPDPNAILNECREINQGIKNIEDKLGKLKITQQRSLDDPDSSANSTTNNELEQKSTEIMSLCRNLAGRIKNLKMQPESGSPRNAPQLGSVDRGLKKAMNDYRVLDTDFRRKLQDQMARQYRIVRPEASEAEVREAVEDTSNQQVFSQALLQSDRRGQSRSALNAVQNRHAAIQKIESQMIELAELFQDMEQLVVQQEAAVVNIEQKGEEVVENMDKGTQEIGTAIKSARNARKWKWWCLGICVLIVIIIVIIVLIYKFVIQNNGTSKKRSINARALNLPIVKSGRVVPAWATTPQTNGKRGFVIPGLEWKGDTLTSRENLAPRVPRRRIAFEA